MTTVTDATDLPEDLDAFLAAFEGAWVAGDVDGILAAMHTDCVYHNIPMDPLVGHDEIRAFLDGFLASTTILFEVRHQLVGDGVVLNERVDTIRMTDRQIEVPVMGTYVFRDGLLAEWRDYFDLAQFAG